MFVRLFKQNLFISNTLTCGGLLGIGDWVQQRCIQRNKHHDWTRTGRMACIGLVLGPMSHGWFGFLDRLYPVVKFSNVTKKILLDQTFGAPTFAFTFITGMCLMEGKTPRASFNEFSHKFPFIYFMDWLVWPPSQAVNFYLIPPSYRVLFVCFIDLCWYTFTSYAKHNDVTLLRKLQSYFDKMKAVLD